MSHANGDPQRESALLRFVYTCPLGLILLDKDGVIRLLNGEATALLVPYSADGMLSNLFEFLAPWAPEETDALRSLAHGQAGTGNVVQRISLSADARECWIELHARPFDDGLSVTCRDVTELVAHEAEFQRTMRREAEQRGRADMAAGILHDMGNALTGIGGRIVAMRSVVDERQVEINLHRLSGLLRRYVTSLEQMLGTGKGQRTVELLTAMVESLAQARGEMEDSMRALETYIGHAQELLTINRTYASGAAGSVAAELQFLFRDVRDMTMYAFRKRRGRMSLSLPDSAPRLAIDRSKLMQIILELVENGLEAWDEQPDVPVAVELSCLYADDGGIVIQVADNGCGFAPERAEQFFQRNVSTKERNSGLGLFASRQLAESFGGRLTLTSAGPGRGTTAKLYLPPEILSNEPSA